MKKNRATRRLASICPILYSINNLDHIFRCCKKASACYSPYAIKKMSRNSIYNIIYTKL